MEIKGIVVVVIVVLIYRTDSRIMIFILISSTSLCIKLCITQLTVMNDKLLIIGPPKSGKFTLIQSLFNSLPKDIPLEAPHQGIIHPITLKTKYFETEIDLWIDETDDFETWSEEFITDEAKEARDVINGLVLVFKFEEGFEIIEKKVESLGKLIDKFHQDNEDSEDGRWGGLIVAVGMGDVNEEDRLKFEDLFVDYGIEMVCFQQQGKNEFGEVLGKERVRQIIECHEWDIQQEESTESTEVNEAGLFGNDDLDDVVKKLQNAKEYIKTLNDDEAKHKYAELIIKELNI